jgi:hypothetical protein
MTFGDRLRQSAVALRACTGLRPEEYAAFERDVLPRLAGAEGVRRQRPARIRAVGAGHPFALSPRDQVLLTVVWLRLYPTHDVLALLFDLGAATTVGRTIARVLPVLEAAGLATMRLPDPGRRQHRTLDALLTDTPALAVVFDTFEQRVQRPTDPAERDHWYSGKKKAHTIKTQVGVDEDTGQIVDVPSSVPGPTADLTLLARSGALARLPAAVGGIGDLAYVSLQRLHPAGLGATPRRKPRGRERPPADVAYNRAFARRRIVVEHSIGRLRHYQCLTQRDRQHRRLHTARVRAVAGLVNRQIDHRLAACRLRAASSR